MNRRRDVTYSSVSTRHIRFELCGYATNFPKLKRFDADRALPTRLVPQILMLSGIGPAAQLTRHGIPVVQGATSTRIAYFTGRYREMPEENIGNQIDNLYHYMEHDQSPPSLH